MVTTVATPLYKTTPSVIKHVLIRQLASIEGYNLVAFNYISASEIWPYKRGGLSRGGGN